MFFKRMYAKQDRGPEWVRKVEQRPHRRYHIKEGLRYDYYLMSPGDVFGALVITNLFTGESVGLGAKKVPSYASLEKHGPLS